MSELDDIRIQVATLRADVDRLQEDAAHTRAIASMADRDASEVRTAIRGIVQTQNALREDFLEMRTEHGRVLREIAGALGAVVATQQEHHEKLSRQDETLTRHGQMLEEILRRLPNK